MSAADVVAIATAVAALLTVGISLFSLQIARSAERTARNADVHGRMPVLVCPEGGASITIHNVGQGPALNIAIARAGDELASLDAQQVGFDELARSSRMNGAHLQPLEAGAVAVYEWAAGPVVQLSYTDALGLPYTTLSSRHGTKFYEGNAMNGLNLKDLPPARRLS